MNQEENLLLAFIFSSEWVWLTRGLLNTCLIFWLLVPLSTRHLTSHVNCTGVGSTQKDTRLQSCAFECSLLRFPFPPRPQLWRMVVPACCSVNQFGFSTWSEVISTEMQRGQSFMSHCQRQAKNIGGDFDGFMESRFMSEELSFQCSVLFSLWSITWLSTFSVLFLLFAIHHMIKGH